MPHPLQVDLWPFTLKVVSESRVTWPTSVPILVFRGLSVLDLGPIYATDRQTSDIRRVSSLNAPTLGAGHNNGSAMCLSGRTWESDRKEGRWEARSELLKWKDWGKFWGFYGLSRELSRRTRKMQTQPRRKFLTIGPICQWQ